MADALTPPLLVASAVLMVAAVAKLRAPAGAVGALVTLGVPMRAQRARVLVRLLAVGELVVAVWVFLGTSRVAYGVTAALYSVFAVITWMLARRRAACGCFGAEGPPASPAQSALSCALAAAALVAALAGAHGAGWMLDLPAAHAVVLVAGVAGAVYGAVLAYTVVPTAWAAWSGR